MNFNQLDEILKIIRESVPETDQVIFYNDSSDSSDSSENSDISDSSTDSDGKSSSDEDEKSEQNLDVLDYGVPIYGCKHYLRRCHIRAPCCKKIYTCRLCHDEAELDHKINRFEIASVICTNCELEQEVSQYCVKCGTCFGLYFCETCRLFSDVDQDQYHCEKCGFCRIGPQEKTIHCDICGTCYPKIYQETHLCKENIKQEVCPVCLETMYDSVDPSINLLCKHMIHRKCFLELIKTSYKCPLCSASMFDLTHFNEEMDEEVAETPMPPEFRHLSVNILCNDCHHESYVPFHIVGMKCLQCGSYNTRQL